MQKGLTVSQKQNPKLWSETGLTHNLPSPTITFPTSLRFKLHSIYWPEPADPSKQMLSKKKSPIDLQAEKVSRLIDEEEKNQTRMNKGHRSKSDFRFVASSPLKDKSLIKKPKLSLANQQIITRLSRTDGFKPQSFARDRHGNRNHLFADDQNCIRLNEQQANILMNTTKNQTAKGFYTSRRLNLNLPLNFNPGPGSYRLPRFLETH